MRGTTLIAVACATFILSGCSIISGSGHDKEDGANHQAESALRTAPNQGYQFADGDYAVELYDPSGAYSGQDYALQDYSGYEVVLYDRGPAQMVNYTRVDPREAAFVKLNGKSENYDWQNCETRSRGYLFISEYDFSLDPHFEVCMRNKGYVLTTEAGSYGDNPVSARTAGLRGYSQPTIYRYP